MNDKLRLHILDDLNQLSRKAADIFVSEYQSSTNHFFIVPGGQTPKIFFKIILNEINEWNNAKFILSDERLTENKDHLNSVMLEKIFKNKGPRLLKFIQNNQNQKIISEIKNIVPQIAILGLGEDSHTASLFPGDPKIFNDTNKIILYTKKQNEDFYRVSLTFNYLMKAKRIVFIVSGSNKAKALKNCLHSNYDHNLYPAQFIFKNYNNRIDIVCDQDSANLIT
tara:strand:- start:170 stop:841 length:672 start_codon:yes stop_codon:yes gene_type:complete